MNAKHWREMCDWYADRYPDSQYTAEDVIVIFEDLKDFDASDVWSAIFWLHEQGQEFPPNASMLLSRCIVERQKTAREDMYRGLPEERGKPEATNWILKRFEEQLSGLGVIQRIHAEMRPCNTKTCDIHYPMKVGAE